MKLEDFAPHVGERFRLELEGAGSIELELVEATALPHRNPDPDSREPFSCVFRGPADHPFGQAIYALRHEVMGSLRFFLVPIGPEGPEGGDGLCYQAIFA